MKLSRLIPLLTIATGTIAALPSQAQTTVNGHTVTDRQRYEFLITYGSPMPAGHFWYDSRSGLWGHWGREVAGALNPGHNFGPLPASASNGFSGVFVNGRQLNNIDVLVLQRLVGRVQRGRFWLDGSGYYGWEGMARPIGNVNPPQQSRRSRREPIWGVSELMGGASNSAGTCTKDGNCYYSGQ
jgi:hypothetical protein